MIDSETTMKNPRICSFNQNGSCFEGFDSWWWLVSHENTSLRHPNKNDVEKFTHRWHGMNLNRFYWKVHLTIGSIG